LNKTAITYKKIKH